MKRPNFLYIAAGEYFSDDGIPNDLTCFEDLPEGVTPWQPFEHWELQEVWENVESLAGRLEDIYLLGIRDAELFSSNLEPTDDPDEWKPGMIVYWADPNHGEESCITTIEEVDDDQRMVSVEEGTELDLFTRNLTLLKPRTTIF